MRDLEGVGKEGMALFSPLTARPAGPSLSPSSGSRNWARLLHSSFPGHTPGARTARAPTGPTVAHGEPGKAAREWSMRISRGSPQPVSFPGSPV